MTAAEHKSDFEFSKTPHTSPSRMSYRVFLWVQWNPFIKATQDGGLSKEATCHKEQNKHDF